jgi:hypothetical protein
LIGCAKDGSKPPLTIAPELRQYSPEFQQRAAQELQAIGHPPCQRQQQQGDLSGCSAIRVMIPDYLELRDDVRAIDEAQDPDGS